MTAFTHVTSTDQPTMVDVAGKTATSRQAIAESRVRLPASVATALRTAGYATSKGPIFQTAIIAGTMAAKRTHELIPFCHPLGIEKCHIDIEAVENDIVIRCSVGVHHKTGVEMEALTGASVAALTVYDMCKALSHDLVISETRLIEKTGGKSDFKAASELSPPPLAGLILAGGHSRRMNSDKAALLYDGKTQLERAYELLSRVVDNVYVSVRADQVNDEVRKNYRQIPDRTTNTGPAAGILSAFSHHPGHAWLVIAVDLPFLTVETLSALLQARDPHSVATAYISAHDGLPEPLCAIWEPSAARGLAAALEKDQRCPRKFLINAHAKLIPLNESESLANVNTPEEYAQAQTLLRAGNSGLAMTTQE